MENTEKKSAPQAAESKRDFSSLLPQYGVPGFAPHDVLTYVDNTDETGAETGFLYMEFAIAQRWFLTVYPNGCFNHVFNNITPAKATATANIFRDASDTRPAATATCTRYFSEDTFGKNYEQNAVTAAYRKALEYLGFCAPLDAVLTDTTKVIRKEDAPDKPDSGVIIPRPMVPVRTPTAQVPAAANPSPSVTSKPSQPVTEPTPKVEESVVRRGRKKRVETEYAVNKGPISVEDAPTPTPASAPAPAAQAQTAPPPPAPKPATGQSAANVVLEENVFKDRMPTLEEATNYRLTQGTNSGKTIEEVAQLQSIDVIRYYANRLPKDSDWQKASQVYWEANREDEETA